jgi:hypothetical protein
MSTAIDTFCIAVSRERAITWAAMVARPVGDLLCVEPDEPGGEPAGQVAAGAQQGRGREVVPGGREGGGRHQETAEKKNLLV